MKMRRLDRWVALLLTLTLWAGSAGAMELDAVMQLMVKRQGGEARFTELRHVSGLDQPLRASGTLSFKAPDFLARVTLLPRPESFTVQGQQITLERGGRVRRMHVDAMPELSAMVAALSGALNGNAQHISQHFQVTTSGTPQQWALALVPLDERVAQRVQELRLAGKQSDLLRVEVRLADGDRSVMTIEPLQPAPPK